MTTIQQLLAGFLVAFSAINVNAAPVDNLLPPWRTTTFAATNDAAIAAVTDFPGPPTPTCTSTLFHRNSFGAFSQPTCTFHESYTTVTEYVDCGGCALRMAGFGHGPAVRCGTYTTLPLGTWTTTICSEGTTAGAPVAFAKVMSTATATATATATSLLDIEPVQVEAE